MLHSIVFSLFCLLGCAAAKCFEPDPAFPVPSWENGSTQLKPAFDVLNRKLKEIANQTKYENSSFSVEVTSKTKTLWSHYGTAKHHNESRPGDTDVDSSSQYRIASCTKVFTVLAILYQAKAGNVSLDHPVEEYIKELKSDEYELPWKDITLRALASQLSGIPREFAQSDIINSLPDPVAIGFPPANKSDIPIKCDEYGNYDPACTKKDLLERLKDFQPLFAPNQKSTYSNLNFELLGIVLENVTGMPYTDYIQKTIFDPLDMTFSTFDKPKTDEHAVLPLGPNYWDVDEGIQNPTGGIYASSSDVSKFLRYVLSHYNSLATGVNWLLPGSWAEGVNSFYGMPWEIFRTDKILVDSKRPVTFVGKSGGLPGYYTKMTIVEDYGLGITVLTAGNPDLLAELLEAVTVDVIRAAEAAIWEDVYNTYHGHYAASSSSLNSSLTLAVSERRGLYATSFISNGTDIFKAIYPQLSNTGADGEQTWHGQLVPTLLFEDEENQKGEIWRFIIVADRPGIKKLGVWDDFCMTDIDQSTYTSIPVNKVIFWLDEDVVELPAFKVKLKRTVDEDLVQDSALRVQS